MTSIASAGEAQAAIYSGTKGAVDAIIRALAVELGPRKIRVNAIAPGGVETEGTHSAGIMGSDFEKAMIAGTPLGRIGQPPASPFFLPPVIPLGSPASGLPRRAATGDADCGDRPTTSVVRQASLNCGTRASPQILMRRWSAKSSATIAASRVST